MHLALIYFFAIIFSIIFIFAGIVFWVPQRYFWFCVSWTILFYFWLFTAISQIAQKPDRHLAYIYAVIFLFVLSLILLLRAQLLSMGIGVSSPHKGSKKKSIYIFRAVNHLTFAAYGLMSAYLIKFHYGHTFAGDQPATKIYLIICLLIFSIASLITLLERLKISKNTIKIINWQFYLSSLGAAIVVLFIYSLSFPPLIINQTNQILQKYNPTSSSYCIQIPDINSPEKYIEIDSLLSLSPLTMQSRTIKHDWYGSIYPDFHGILVVKKQNSTDLYNWSYQQHKWSYLAPESLGKAKIEQLAIACKPQKNYLQQLPLIFPLKN